jgi:opacity protein-like surface antigen
MKRFVLLCALTVCFAGVVSAQDMPKVDVFGGYSFAHVSENGFGINSNGGSASAAFHPNGWLGLVADFGGYHTDSSGVSENIYSFLFGPRVNFGHGKLEPFVQGLFGGAHASSGNVCVAVSRVHLQGTTQCGSFSNTSFAMTLGGGLDWNATEHLGIRLAQLEYLMTDFASRRQNGVRLSTGVVIRF